MELDKLITIEDFCSDPENYVKFLRHRVIHLYLPTATEVTSPEIVVPFQSRVWGTERWLVDGKILDYSELNKLPDFHGTCNYDEIYLYEYWTDEGSDGWSDYKHIGYIFSDLKLENDKYPYNALALRLVENSNVEL